MQADEPEVRQRIAELTELMARFTLEREQAAAQERDYRAREDAARRIDFAREIFELHQEQLRLQVEVELVRKKIRRLELGYAEDASPNTAEGPQEDFLF
jgi:predicted  nucleic acid-binding Zn-ribbon protein